MSSSCCTSFRIRTVGRGAGAVEVSAGGQPATTPARTPRHGATRPLLRGGSPSSYLLALSMV